MTLHLIHMQTVIVNVPVFQVLGYAVLMGSGDVCRWRLKELDVGDAWIRLGGIGIGSRTMWKFSAYAERILRLGMNGECESKGYPAHLVCMHVCVHLYGLCGALEVLRFTYLLSIWRQFCSLAVIGLCWCVFINRCVSTSGVHRASTSRSLCSWSSALYSISTPDNCQYPSKNLY